MNQYPINIERERTAKTATLVVAVLVLAVVGWVWVSSNGKNPTLEGLNGKPQTWSTTYSMSTCEDFLRGMSPDQSTVAAGDYLRLIWDRQLNVSEKVPTGTAKVFRNSMADACGELAARSGYPDWYDGTSLAAAASLAYQKSPVRP